MKKRGTLHYQQLQQLAWHLDNFETHEVAMATIKNYFQRGPQVVTGPQEPKIDKSHGFDIEDIDPT